MPTVYLIGVVPPITAEAIEDHLQYHADVTAADCRLLPGDCVATVEVEPSDLHRLLNTRFLRIRGRLVAVSEECPTKSSGPSVVPLLPHVPRASVIGRAVTQLLYRNDARKRAPNVYKVCLTGGPCAGKTTLLSTIMTKFPSHGVKTYAVPEAATILIAGGLSFADATPDQIFRYQLTLLTTQLDLERNFLDLAMTNPGPCLLVCDRGAMDGKAYCDEPTWEKILGELSLDTVQLRDQQYDAVMHLVTAANGAEEFYGTATNAVRMETPEEARTLDSRTLNVYLGHPHLRIIDNSTDFTTKMERVLTFISEGMGITIPTQGSYRRYLVSSPAPTTLPVPTVRVEVEIAILQNPLPEPELRIIARQQNCCCSYFYQKLRTVNGKPVVTERKLTFEEYQELRKQIDLEFEVIQKSSLSFTYNNQYFEMGTFINPAQYAGLALLYIEIGSHSGEPDLPPFIPVEREVTDDPQYTSMAMSQADYGAMDVGRSFSAKSKEKVRDKDQLDALFLSIPQLSLKSPKHQAPASGIYPPKRDSCSEQLPFSWVPKRGNSLAASPSSSS